MKSNNNSFDQLEYLPEKLIDSFAKSYSLSFPELKLDQSSLIKFLKRKFQTLDDPRLLNIAALLSNDGVVASGYGIVRNRYSIGEESINIGLVCDVFTNSDFRKMGLFKKVSLLAIAREESTKTNLLIGFPIRDEVMPGHISVGWKYIFDMPIWWSFPRLGSLRNVFKNPDFTEFIFSTASKSISLEKSTDYLKWRLSLFNVDYFFVSIPNSADFAIIRRAKIKKIPFTCIVFLHSSNKENSRILIGTVRNMSLRLGTFGVLGCWNNSYADDLFLSTSGLRKSSKFQKVIVRELNGFNCPNDEAQYRLSWLDSDTL
jgi:hypothetical protein